MQRNSPEYILNGKSFSLSSCFKRTPSPLSLCNVRNQDKSHWTLQFSPRYQQKGWICKGNREWSHTRNSRTYKCMFPITIICLKAIAWSPLFTTRWHILQCLPPTSWQIFRVLATKTWYTYFTFSHSKLQCYLLISTWLHAIRERNATWSTAR